jgi:hypothetical protein
LTRLREAVASLSRQTATGTAQGSYGWSGTASGVAPGLTVEERLARLERALRAAIDDAITAERKRSDAIRLQDLYPALAGILVGIAGTVCQLWPSLVGFIDCVACLPDI